MNNAVARLFIIALMALAFGFYASAARADESCPIGHSWDQGSGSCQAIVCPTGTLMNAGYGCDPIICPTGTILEGNMCNTIYCSSGYRLDHDSNSCVQVVCSSGTRLVGDTCEPIICSEGHRLNASGTDCEQFTCGNDERIRGNGCEPLNCGYGYRANNGLCEQVICGAGELLNTAGNACEPVVCPEGNQFNISANTCVPTSCPEGQRFNGTGTACESFTCGYGLRVAGNDCQSFICAPGERYTAEGNSCEPIICPTGQQLNYDTCTPIVCTSGTRLNSDGICESFSCEAGTRLSMDGTTCEPFTCGYGEQIQDNQCVPFGCQWGEKYNENGSACVPLTCASWETPGGSNGNECVTAPCNSGERRNENHVCESFTCPAGKRILDDSCVDLNCGPGMKVDGNSCVMAPSCPAGSVYFKDGCKETSCANQRNMFDGSYNGTCETISCPAGEVLSNGSCVAATPTCAVGEQLVNGACVPVTCDAGTRLNSSGACEAFTCPAGKYILGNSCADLNCPAGKKVEGNICVDVPTCSTGEQLNEETNTCEPVAPPAPTCPVGSSLSDGICINTICPTGQVALGTDGVCTPLDCPAGKVVWGNSCVSACPSTMESISGICYTKCATNQDRVGTQCLAKCTSGKVRSGTQCVASCPVGQVAEAGTCQPLVCPTGQHVSGSSCVATTCPSGQYALSNDGTCTTMNCPAGTKPQPFGWGGSMICQPFTCPIGQEVSGNTCVTRTATCENVGKGVGSCYTTPAESIPDKVTNYDLTQLDYQMQLLGLEKVRREGYDGSTYTRDVYGRVTGKTGSELVAVIDSGISGSVRTNAVVGGVTCQGGVCTSGDGSVIVGSKQDYHGTVVGSQISGAEFSAAPGAKLLAVNMNFDDPQTFANLTAGTIWATQQGARIINASIGAGPGISSVTGQPCGSGYGCTWSFNNVPAQYRDYYINTLTPAMNALYNTRSVMVVSAGNSGYNQPTMIAEMPRINSLWKSSVIAAVSVDSHEVFNIDGTIKNKNPGLSVFKNYDGTSWGASNACGASATWCLAAPGNGVLTKNWDESVSYSQGTSMAAPQISAALAMLTGAFPQLNAQQAAQILFKTATDLGAVGVDSVYGWGLMNFEKAFNPSDSKWSIPTGYGSNDGQGTISNSELAALSGSLAQLASYQSMDFNSSHLSLASAFGSALSGTGLQVMFLDEFYKNYSVPLSSLVRNNVDSGSAEQRLEAMARSGSAFDQTRDFGFMRVMLSLGAQDSSNIAAMPIGTTANLNSTSQTSTLAKGAVQFNTAAAGGNITGALGYKASPADLFSAAAFGSIDHLNSVMADTLRNPYLALTREATSAGAGFRKGMIGLRAAAYSGTLNTATSGFAEPDRMQGAMAELTVGDRDAAISITAGTVKEDTSMLGARSGGALSLGNGSATHYGSIAGKVALTDNISFLANYNMGATRVSASSASLVQDIGNVMTDSFSAGLEFRELVRDGDNLQVSFSQPLRVRSAKASLFLPTSVDENGVIGFTSQNVSLAAPGREFNFDSYYTTAIDSESDLKLGATLRLQPGHDVNAEAEMITMARYSLRF